MRKITLQEQTTRKWKLWRTACNKETESLKTIVAQGKEPKIKENLYRRKSIKNDYFFSKGDPFYGKCAYCEAYIPDFQHGDVEHFRPKGGVTDEDDQPIFLIDDLGKPVIDENGNSVPHPGYYWLAYDWRNLLPSCTVCNQPKKIGDKKIGKHNRFPVSSAYAKAPNEELNEIPLLIHPASNNPSDDPDKHLTIDASTGVMGHHTDRGKMCIQIFGLNLRDQLMKDRQRACREVRSLLVELINSSDPNRRGELLAELNDIRDGKRSYTMAARAVLAELKPIFEPLFNHN